MLARLVMFVLSLTALAPIAAVWMVKNRGAAALIVQHQIERSLVFWVPCVFVLLSMGFALWLLHRVVPRRCERRVLNAQKSESIDKEVLSFLIAYMLPLIVQSEKPIDWPTTIVVGLLLLLVIWRAQLIHINPLLGLFGFHFFKITAESGQTHLLITRNSSVAPAELTVFRLSEVLWYEEGKRPDS